MGNKYEKLADDIIDLVGGKDNILSFIHCVTRLRFNVKDKNLVKVKEIESYQGVIGTNWSNNQIQIIIGQEVGDVYELIKKKNNIGDGSIDENLDGDRKKKISINTILDYITGSIIPLLPVLIGAGFIKLIASILTLTGILTQESSTFIVLNFVGDAGFYFLPIFIGQGAAKKLGANQGLGMLLGAIFIHPTFVETVSAGTALSVFGLPIFPNSYASSVFPILLAVAVMAPIEKFIGKHSPNMIRMIMQPVLTILIMVPIALCLVGPLGGVLGNVLSTGIIWLNETLGFIGVALLSAIYPLLVMTGMHTALIPHSLNMLATTGAEAFLLPAAVIASINQGVANLAVGVKTKQENIKGIAFPSSITAILSGVFEPALYGINLKYKTPLYSSMIGSAIGAAVAGFGHAAAYTFGGGTGLMNLPSFIGEPISTFVWMVAGVITGIICTFVLTLFMYKDEVVEATETTGEQASNTLSEVIQSPVSAKVIPLSDVKDNVFSDGLMGKGVALIPTENLIKSPIEGEVISVFPTGHAIGLKSKSGAEILIHIGMDTVQLNGEGFEILVENGEKISKGTPLIKVDFEEIGKKGYDISTPIVVTNTNDYHKVEIIKEVFVTGGERLINLEAEDL